MKLSIVIPVYNEKNTILEIISKVKSVEGINKEIIVVDDCSTDGTTEILRNLEKSDSSIKFKFKQVNSGKGSSLKEGFKLATGDYVIVQDADLEYEPNDYKILLAALNTENKVVYGSRFSGKYEDMSSLHYHGNQLLTSITNILFGTKLTDMETCYKLLPFEFVNKVEIKSQRFNFEPEITAKILKAGYKINEVPITYKGRTHTEGKKITWVDGISAVQTLLWFRFFD